MNRAMNASVECSKGIVLEMHDRRHPVVVSNRGYRSWPHLDFSIFDVLTSPLVMSVGRIREPPEPSIAGGVLEVSETGECKGHLVPFSL